MKANRNYTKTGWTTKPNPKYSPCPQCEIRRLGIQPKPRIAFLLRTGNWADGIKAWVEAVPVFSFQPMERPKTDSPIVMGYYKSREEALNAIETEAKHYYEYAIFE